MRKITLTEADRKRIIEEAHKLLGKPYKLRGDGIDTFNCSQFVVAVIRNALGIDLPPKVDWLFLISKVINQEDLQIGDLVFFCYQPRPKGRIATHVAIYIGNGNIIHARQRAGEVTIEPMIDFSETMITSKNIDVLNSWLNETIQLTWS